MGRGRKNAVRRGRRNTRVPAESEKEHWGWSGEEGGTLELVRREKGTLELVRRGRRNTYTGEERNKEY